MQSSPAITNQIIQQITSNTAVGTITAEFKTSYLPSQSNLPTQSRLPSQSANRGKVMQSSPAITNHPPLPIRSSSKLPPTRLWIRSRLNSISQTEPPLPPFPFPPPPRSPLALALDPEDTASLRTVINQHHLSSSHLLLLLSLLFLLFARNR